MLLVTRSKVIGCETGGIPEEMARKLISMMGLPVSDSSMFASRSLLSANDVLCKTELDLMELLDVPLPELMPALDRVQECVCPPPRSVLSLWEERKEKEIGGSYLATKFKELDEALGGGVPFGLITELVGAPGVGKTQFCLMLSVMAAMPTVGGPNRSVIYIDTEHKFSSGRMMEIAQNQFPELAVKRQMMQQLAERVLVLHPSSLSDLMKSLQRLEVMVIEHAACLVIIDSVAALLSLDAEGDDFVQRQEALGKQASLLKFIAESVRIPVVVTNQVRTKVIAERELRPPVLQHDMSFLGNDEKPPDEAMADIAQSTNDKVPPGEAEGEVSNLGHEELPEEAMADTSYLSRHEEPPDMAMGEDLTAALGTKWAHCVNIRLWLEFSVSGDRQIKIVKSPMSPFAIVPYRITSKGLELELQAPLEDT